MFPSERKQDAIVEVLGTGCWRTRGSHREQDVGGLGGLTGNRMREDLGVSLVTAMAAWQSALVWVGVFFPDGEVLWGVCWRL